MSAEEQALALLVALKDSDGTPARYLENKKAKDFFVKDGVSRILELLRFHFFGVRVERQSRLIDEYDAWRRVDGERASDTVSSVARLSSTASWEPASGPPKTASARSFPTSASLEICDFPSNRDARFGPIQAKTRLWSWFWTHYVFCTLQHADIWRRPCLLSETWPQHPTDRSRAVNDSAVLVRYQRMR